MTRSMSKPANICITVHGNNDKLKFKLSIINDVLTFSKDRRNLCMIGFLVPWRKSHSCFSYFYKSMQRPCDKMKMQVNQYESK